MKTHRWEDVRAARFTPEQLAEIDREVNAELLKMDLKEIREAAGKTQVQVAAKAKMKQAALSRLEKGDMDSKLSTLRRFVEALGGELEHVAVFGNRRVQLRGLSSSSSSVSGRRPPAKRALEQRKRAAAPTIAASRNAGRRGR